MRIVGQRVVLRDEMHAGDDEKWFEWLNLPEWQYYDEPDQPFKLMTRAEFQRMRARLEPPRSEYQPRCYVDTRAGRFIGWLNSYGYNAMRRSLYIGIALPEEDTWSRGYGGEAFWLWIDYLFRALVLNEVRAVTWPGNERMMRCALRCGMTEAGRGPHRLPQTVRGEPLERVEYAMRRSAWLALSPDA